MNIDKVIQHCEDMKKEIDNMSLKEMMRRARFAPTGDPLFQGTVGSYFMEAMLEKKQGVAHEELVRISKEIGWS